MLGNISHHVFVSQSPYFVSIYDKWEWPCATYLVLTLCSCLGCVDGSQVKWYALESLEVTSPSNSIKRIRHDQDGVQSYNKQTRRKSVSSPYETTSPQESETQIDRWSDAIPWSHLVVFFLCKESTRLFIVIHVIVQLSVGHLSHDQRSTQWKHQSAMMRLECLFYTLWQNGSQSLPTGVQSLSDTLVGDTLSPRHALTHMTGPASSDWLTESL